MKKCKVTLLILSALLVLSGCGNNNGYLKKGVKAIEKEKYSEAVQIFEEMIAAESEDKPKDDKKKKIQENNLSEAYKGLGIAYYETKEYEKALDAYIKCTELDGTKSASMYRNMVVCANKINNFEAAVEYAEDGIRLINEDKDYDEENIKEDLYIMVIQNLEAGGNFAEAYDWAVEYNNLFPGNKDMEKEIKFLETR